MATTVNSEKLLDESLVTGGRTFADVNDDVSRPLENFPTKIWWVAFIRRC